MDPLTRLLNRKDIIEKLKYGQLKFGRYGRIFSIILGDIEGFEKNNEKIGKDADGYELKEIVETLKKLTRRVDNIRRCRGNEYLIILAAINLAGAERLTEKIINYISFHKYGFDKNSLQVAMSFSMACYMKKYEKTGEELLKVADQRPCEVREKGRSFMLSA